MSDQYFVVGLDLGEMQDYTALAILQPVYGAGEKEPASYHLRHLQRYSLGTPYPQMCQSIQKLLATSELAGRSTLVLDSTGVGQAIRDLFAEAGLTPIGITIHGGDTVTRDSLVWHTELGGGYWQEQPVGYHVPKRDIISNLQLLYQQERLQVAAELPEVETFIQELTDYRVTINEQTGHDSYNARAGAHDDLILAVGVAAWYHQNRMLEICQAVYDPVRIGRY